MKEVNYRIDFGLVSGLILCTAASKTMTEALAAVESPGHIAQT